MLWFLLNQQYMTNTKKIKSWIINIPYLSVDYTSTISSLTIFIWERPDLLKSDILRITSISRLIQHIVTEIIIKISWAYSLKLIITHNFIHHFVWVRNIYTVIMFLLKIFIWEWLDIFSFVLITLCVFFHFVLFWQTYAGRSLLTLLRLVYFLIRIRLTPFLHLKIIN